LGHGREHEGEWVSCDVSEFVPPGMILDDIRIDAIKERFLMI